MRLQPNWRVSVHCFALSLHPHAHVVMTSCRANVMICVCYVCVYVAFLLQICAIVWHTVEFDAKKTSVASNLRLWCMLQGKICADNCASWFCMCASITLSCFSEGLLHRGHFRSRARERRPLTYCVSTKGLTLKNSFHSLSMVLTGVEKSESKQKCINVDNGQNYNCTYVWTNYWTHVWLCYFTIKSNTCMFIFSLKQQKMPTKEI